MSSMKEIFETLQVPMSLLNRNNGTLAQQSGKVPELGFSPDWINSE